MTCAGIGAMVMAEEMLDDGDARVVDNQVKCCQPHEADASVERGLEWLGRHFSVRVNPGDDPRAFLLYYLYGLERTGRLTNQHFIGRHDWYREGAEYLVNEQEDLHGQWKGTGLGETTPGVGTSLALLFLAKGRRPVVAAKLRHGPGEDWNHHRKDLANLVTYTEKKWGRDLTWQVIDIDAAKADDLIEAPILYLCGEQAPEISDDDVAKLREYVNRGGFIFADAVCDGQDFDRGFRRLMDRVFPEPEHPLHLLGPEHAVWSTEEPVDPRFVRPLWGIDVGCRTSVIYCPDNLSCYWELARPGRELVQEKKYPAEIQARITAARAIGVNVLAYATNREPKYKLDLPQLAEQRCARFDRPRQAVRGHGQALGGMERGADGATEPAALPVGRDGPAHQHRCPRSEPQRGPSVRVSRGLYPRPQRVSFQRRRAQAVAHLSGSRRRVVCRRHLFERGVRQLLPQGNGRDFPRASAGPAARQRRIIQRQVWRFRAEIARPPRAATARRRRSAEIEHPPGRSRAGNRQAGRPLRGDLLALRLKLRWNGTNPWNAPATPATTPPGWG